MQRDLLDVLRCPHMHDESWLVAMVHEANGADLRAATLACPVCEREFAVQDGIAHFGPPRTVDDRTVASLSPDALAALLGVGESTAPVLLTGAFAALGAGMGALVEAPQVWLNAPLDASPSMQPAAQLISPERAPLGAGTMAAVAIDAAHAQGAMLDSLVNSVRPGGRVVAPARVALSGALRELARDDAWQVAETTAPARGLITLRRRPPDV